MARNLYLTIILLGLSYSLTAQVSIADSVIQLIHLDLRYQGMFPTGQMAEDWGYFSNVGAEAGIKTRQNFSFSIGFHSLFTQTVKTAGILDPLLNDGFLTTDEGVVSQPRVLGVGWMIPARIGKIFPIGPRPNDNSGIYLSVGGQFLRYRFDFRSGDGPVGGLAGAYEDGYDHLRSGWGLNQSLGYRYYSNRGDVNFKAGIELAQNYTLNRRSIHFVSGPAAPSPRWDNLLGFFLTWTYPLYERAPSRVYYY